ncbi:MAG TPA: M20 family metallopeptidase [Conexibacter sp.]|nr:M20 family metallopeptidase [Conexibacter sp.]
MTAGTVVALEPLLRALVAADSSNPPGDERPVAAAIERTAAELGLPQAHVLARDVQRPNLLFELGGGSPTLLIGAHMDTVPPDDLGAWHTDPHVLRAEGETYVGLGVADMKGAIAAMLLAAARLRGRLPAGRLLLAFTADEEDATGHGMEWLCEQRLLAADAAVLLEPGSATERSWDALYVGERGSCVVELTAHGRAGHSGEPLSASARAGTALLDGLGALRAADLFAGHRHAVDGTGPIVNLPTMLSGGTTPWAHPGSFHATLEIRTVPGMRPDDVLGELRDVLRADGLDERVTLALGSWGEPSATVTDARLLAAARRALDATLGHVPADAVFPASTDAGFLARIGIPTLPALGPGTLGAVHRPNEWVPREDLERTVDLVEQLALAYLGG